MADVKEVLSRSSDTRQQDNIRRTREKEEFVRERVKEEIRSEEDRRSEISNERVALEREQGQRVDVSV